MDEWNMYFYISKYLFFKKEETVKCENKSNRSARQSVSQIKKIEFIKFATRLFEVKYNELGCFFSFQMLIDI